MDLCGSCELDILEDFCYCVVCKSKYHFECNTISESSWRTMGPERKAAWKCSSCRNVKKPNKNNVPEMPTGTGNKENEDKTIETISKQFAMQNKKMDERFNAFEATLNFYTDKFDTLATSMKTLEQKMLIVEKQLQKSESENKELKKRVRDMEVQTNTMEQKQNNNLLEITGIKDKEINENNLMEKIMEKAELEPGNNIQYRVEKVVKPTKDNRYNTTIFVHFNSQVNRNSVLNKIKQGKLYNKVQELKNNDSTSMFINEYLCPYYRRLFFEANKLKKEKQFAYLWIKDGKILLKRTKEGKTENLVCMDDLGKL
uniref:FP protein C-terminal domain-containing protein n=1 Tax=Cacopsylla melanoneura TaxID=428564 RepID=A0A8D8ZBE4_9HEMI